MLNLESRILNLESWILNLICNLFSLVSFTCYSVTVQQIINLTGCLSSLLHPIVMIVGMISKVWVGPAVYDYHDQHWLTSKSCKSLSLLHMSSCVWTPSLIPPWIWGELKASLKKSRSFYFDCMIKKNCLKWLLIMVDDIAHILIWQLS